MHGIARVALRFIENAVRLAPENEYIVLTRHGTDITALPKADCLSISRCDTKLYGIAERFVIPRILKRLSPDLYYSPTYFAPSRACCPVVFTIYDLTYTSVPGCGSIAHRAYFNIVVRRAASNAARVITNSRYVAGELSARLQIPAGKITTVHLGADEAFGADAGPADIDGPYILNVSNHFVHKNTATLLGAYEIFLAKGGGRYKLVIIGKQNKTVEEMISRNEGLRRHVELLGQVNDTRLVKLMRGASLFVLPSRYEGFGLPVLEATKAGVPVVAGNNTALAELFRDCACLVDPDSPEAVADAIERVLANEGERQRMTAKGLEFSKNFTWDKMARNILAIFDEVLAGA
jgi:glycosyltransferase involved in cell wall biosynthesis